MIFQFFNLLDDLTVADNVLLPAQLAGMRPAPARARAAELLAQLGIERYANTYPGRLSGGERQRVAIARALVNNPAVLLADEPTGAVDTATGEEIGRLLLDLNAGGQTLILVTHSPDLAARYAKRTVRLARRPDRQRHRAAASAARRPAGRGVAAVTGGAVIKAASGGATRRLVPDRGDLRVLAAAAAARRWRPDPGSPAPTSCSYRGRRQHGAHWP